MFSAVIGWLGPSIANVETDQEQTQGAVWVVSGNFFEELGVRPLAGRLLDRSDVNETTLESRPVAVIGYSFWQRHYGTDRHVIGQRLRVQNEQFDIVGIAPAGFRALDLTIEPDVTVPLTAFPLIADRAGTSLRTDTSFWVRTTARLKPGVTVERARAALDALWSELKTTTCRPSTEGRCAIALSPCASRSNQQRPASRCAQRSRTHWWSSSPSPRSFC